MYLRSLVVNGFKSFPEAKIEFPRGVTAVVGPNGAGKSNIVDAILWGLGEQSSKSLRSERMEDVIFNGTALQKPVGMADVSVVFGGVTSQELEMLSGIDDSLGHASEIMISRRLYRDGESEYLLNKIPCRLKDIRSFLWAARAGTKGHTVIEQGSIEELLSASPLERREFIEETAGIIRYKKQKAEAIRKLNSTHQNLQRVHDILAEVQRQLRSLARQAKQAQEYQTINKEVKTLEIQLLHWEYQTLTEDLHRMDTELAELETQESANLAEEGRILAEQETTQLSLTTMNDAVSQTRNQLQTVEQEIATALTAIEVERTRLDQYDRQHDQVLHERNRTIEMHEQAQGSLHDIQARLEHTHKEVESLRLSVSEYEQQSAAVGSRRTSVGEQLNQGRRRILDLTVQKTNTENHLKNLEENQQSLIKRLDRLSGEQEIAETQERHVSSEEETYRQQRERLEHELQQMKVKRNELDQALQALRHQLQGTDDRLFTHQTELAGVESELRALRTVVREEFGYGPSGEIETTSIRGVCEEIKEGLAERMEVPEEMEKAIEAALGEKMKAWVVESPHEACRAIRTLKQHSLGSATFVPLRKKNGRESPGQAWWVSLQNESTVKGRALEFIHATEDLQEALISCLEHVVIVESLESGLHLMDQYGWFNGQGPLFATMEGETLHSTGVMTGGAGMEVGGCLHRRREISTLETTLNSLVIAIEDDQSDRETVAATIGHTEGEMATLSQTIGEWEVQIAEIKKEEGARRHALPELARRIATIKLERESEETDLARMKEDAGLFQERITSQASLLGQQEEALHELQATLQSIEQEETVVHGKLTDARMTLNALAVRYRHDQEELSRLQQEEEARNRQLTSFSQQMEDLFQRAQESQATRLTNETRFEELENHKSALSVILKEQEEQYAKNLERVRRFETQLVGIRDTLKEQLKGKGSLEVRMAERRTKLEIVEETLSGTYGLSSESFAGNEWDPSSSSQEKTENLENKNDSMDASSTLPEGWRNQLHSLRSKLERMGPINLAAIEEHQELEERHRFLTEQEEDLSKSIQSLQEIIRRLNRTTHQLFTETFHALQEKFNEVFTALFAGGKAELVLVNPEEDEESETCQQELGVDIVAQPPGKRLKNLAMLSGGEKTLTVLALLFSSFLIKPSPFCILDEVDAPLDESNVVRFSQFMRQMFDRSQFLVITHNKRTMEVADSLFGVTMEEPGISKLISVHLKDMHAVG